MSHLPISRLPTWEDIHRAALHSPIVNHYLTRMRNRELTEQEALLGMVLALADAYEEATTKPPPERKPKNNLDALGLPPSAWQKLY